MKKIPGLSVKTNSFLSPNNESFLSNPTLQRQPHKTSGTINLNSWFIASINTRNTLSDSIASDNHGISVLLDGYISDILNEPNFTSLSHAEKILFLYKKNEKLNFLNQLRGSYTCLIIDKNLDQAFLFNDRRASRPLFIREDKNSSFLLDPEVSILAAHEPKLKDIDHSYACEFLIFGSFYSNHTLFPSIHKIPQAALITFSRQSIDISQYWHIQYSPCEGPYKENLLIEECHYLIQQSVRRIIKNTEKPFLFLSGGTDSRVILGAILEQQDMIPIVTYGINDGDSDSDFNIARSLANKFNLPLSEFNISQNNIQEYFLSSSLESDCRAETIDTPSLYILYQELSNNFSTFINGVECFGLNKKILSTQQALLQLEMHNLSQVSRLGDWLNPLVRKDISKCIEECLNSLVIESKEIEPNNLRDHLYYSVRYSNLQNAFTAEKMRHFEQGCPLVDEDIIDFITHLPLSMRNNKYLLRQVLKKKYPHLLTIPLANKDSIPTANIYKNLIFRNKTLAKYIHTNLVNNLDSRLESMIDIKYLTPFIETLITKNSFEPIKTNWWMNVPGAWRLGLQQPENKVHPITLLLRILQLNLYLNHYN